MVNWTASHSIHGDKIMPSQPALDLAREIVYENMINVKAIREEIQWLSNNLNIDLVLPTDATPDKNAITRLAERIDAVARQTATTVYEVVLDTHWELAQHSFGIFSSQEEADKFIRNHPLSDEIYTRHGVREWSNGYEVIEWILNEPHMGEFGEETRRTNDKG